MTARAFTLLLVEPDDGCAEEVEVALRTAGVGCRRVADAEAGWREFARARPDTVLTAWQTPRQSGAWFLRRLHEDYMGALPPVYALFSPEELLATPPGEDLDAAFLRPFSPALLLPLITGAVAEEQPQASAARLRELFELSLLGGDLDAATRLFLERARRAFRADDFCIAGPERSFSLSGLAEPLGGLAVAAGTTLVDSSGAGRSLVAAAAPGPRGEPLGWIGAVATGARRFSAEEMAALRALGRRTGTELAWRAAHARLAADHDRLRMTAQTDPLLGVPNRSALDEALAVERARAGDTPVAVAILDAAGMKPLNERHGHIAGDAALEHITRKVRAALRPQDVLGRLGGDKLALILPGLDVEPAERLLEELVRAVAAEPMAHLGGAIALAIRAGGTLIAADGAPLAIAEAALLTAKRRRASLFFHVPGSPLPSGAGVAPESVPAGGLTRAGELTPGTTLGGVYQVLHEISRGAMGVVYRAEDLGLRRPVAVKVLRPDLARDVELVERFRNEAALLASVRHDNLVAVHSFGSQGDVVYFVMELVEGESLAELIRRHDEAGQPVPTHVVSDIVSQVADALTAMHRAGVIHRDVKPANVLIDRARERVVLVDVGVAKHSGLGSEEAVGTPGFAAPESFTRGAEGPTTDVYGLAATAYMLLTNLAPFGGGDAAKVVRRQLQEAPAPPTLLRRDLGRAVDEVLARALAPAAGRRPGTPTELAAALGAALLAPPAPRVAVRAGDIDVELFETEERQLRAVRGAVYRAAYRVLGNRLGSGWIAAALARDPALAQVVGPEVAPRDWVPVDLLPSLLAGSAAAGRDPVKLAREIGRVVAGGPFGRYDGEGIDTAEQLFADSRRYWPRYASWGTLAATIGAGHASIILAGGPREIAVCGFVEGLLERLAELAGGVDAKAWHVRCRARGDEQCLFELRWSPPRVLRQ